MATYKTIDLTHKTEKYQLMQKEQAPVSLSS